MSIIKKLLPLLIIITCGVLVINSCKKYEKKPENSSFFIKLETERLDSDTIEGCIILTDGTVNGECKLSLLLTDNENGSHPSYQVAHIDGSKLNDEDVWSFDKNGEFRFHILGLPAGSYTVKVTVTRWYHTATCTHKFNF